MTVRLTVQESAWRGHVLRTARHSPGLVPVVKGNGYGFGRTRLASLAVEMLDAPLLAVGTVHEAVDVPLATIPLVLTPTADRLPDTLPAGTILTVGAIHHVEALGTQGWRGPVVIKVASSMHRYGTDDVAALADACHRHHLEPVAAAIHLPLVGTVHDHLAEIENCLPDLARHLPSGTPLDVSHLDAAAYADLRERHPDQSFRIRVGTALWHGDKSTLHLGATVTDVRPVVAGQRLGYRHTESPISGHVVLVGAGSAHGVLPLDGGASPFHHARRRLALLEPPHMHTSMVLVPEGDTCPEPGDLLDVQRPLILTQVDEVSWV